MCTYKAGFYVLKTFSHLKGFMKDLEEFLSFFKKSLLEHKGGNFESFYLKSGSQSHFSVSCNIRVMSAVRPTFPLDSKSVFPRAGGLKAEAQLGTFASSYPVRQSRNSFEAEMVTCTRSFHTPPWLSAFRADLLGLVRL